MTQFEIYKLLTDIGLFGSLVFFAYRFSRNQAPVNQYEMEQLQNGLRSAIREADQAGRGLNDQLFQRKQTLEKLLFDLETVESRVNRAINTAEERKGELQLVIDRVKQMQGQYEEESRPHIEKTNVNINALQKEDNQIEIETPSFSAVASIPKKGDLLEVSAEAKTNIFGEPIIEDSSVEQQATPNSEAIENIEKKFVPTPLTTKIEKEIEVPEALDTDTPVISEDMSIEEVYTQAEDLIRAGKAVEEVCKITQLTADEVRLLTQLMDHDSKQAESAPAEVVTADERLGVLAGFKRQTQVL